MLIFYNNFNLMGTITGKLFDLVINFIFNLYHSSLQKQTKQFSVPNLFFSVYLDLQNLF